jgi:hypothetical protein
MRVLRPALVTAGVLLTAVAPASATTTKWRASLTGTYTQQGTVTDTRCFSSDENDNVTYFTRTGTASENDSFQSVKPVTLSVTRVRGQRTFDAGSLKHLRTTFTLSRQSDLAGTETPSGCRPNSTFGAPAPDCGIKKLTFPLRVYGRTDHPGFSYLFTKNFSTYYPDDPYDACSLAGGVWPGQLQQSGTGKVAPAKLFRRSAKKLVVHGGDSDSKHDSSGSVTIDSSYKLSWTLTLRRP